MAEKDMGSFASFESAKSALLDGHKEIASYDVPWWGDKETEGIKNRGFVIGFKNEAKSARWRLDYDPVKGLHVNWSQDNRGGEATKECYRISSTRAQDTLNDYFVSWPRSHFEDIPADIKERLGAGKKWQGRYWA